MTDSNRPMMEIFTRATGTTIDRSHFSNVGRDQNNYTINQSIVQTRKRKFNKNIPDLSEFTEINRGDIYKNKDVCYSWRLCSNGQDGTESAVYIAQIIIGGRFEENHKFTIKTYRGRNAMKEWRRDFLRCSKDLNAPLFGYNRSSAPSLIFHGELMPLAHIESQLGEMGLYYINLLIGNLGCLPDELWMDPIKGRFYRGPIGPECRPYHDRGAITIPSDVGFLKDDVVVRYLSSTKYHLWFLNALVISGNVETVDPTLANSCPEVISGCTRSTFALTRRVRWWKPSYRSPSCLHKGFMMSWATRFCLRDDGRDVCVFSDSEESSWLAQALSIFHAHNISLDEDLSKYKFIYPFFTFRGTLKKSKRKRQRRQLCSPIYLFLRLPSPSAPADFYSWSLDPTGQTELSPDMCKYLGLPFYLSLRTIHNQHSWSTKIYRDLSEYQLARGFNPTTTDFARFNGYYIYEIPSAENLGRFEESSELTIPAKRSQLGKLFAPLMEGFRYLTCRNLDANK